MLVVNNVTKTYGKFVALENINLEFDTAIISGMGGILIKDILTEALEKYNEDNSTSVLINTNI